MNDLDLAELQKWVAISGMECVARVAVELTAGERGNVTKPDNELLLEMALRLRDNPMLTTHDAAAQIAREAKDWRNPIIETASLTTELARAFGKHRTKWLVLAQSFASPSRWSASIPHKKKSTEESRALGRIIEMLPGAIDLYDAVLQEATHLRPEKVAIIKKLGREHVANLLAPLIIEQMAMPRTEPRNTPRNFLDLLEPQLELEQQRLREPARSARTRRKPAK
jgi:hypothetical protein